MPRKLTQAEYEQRVNRIGKVAVDDTYIDAKTRIFHICKKHGERHLAIPSNIVHGQGLKCCKPAKLTQQVYESRVKKIGRVVVDGTYVDRKTDIYHICNTHHERHLAKPDNILQGHGLICCKPAKPSQEVYELRVHEIGRVTVSDTYIDRFTPIFHTCNEHGERYLAMPGNILKGRGLQCCLIANRPSGAREKMQRAIAEYDKILKIKNPNLIRIDPCIDNSTPINHFCNKHGKVNLISPSNAKQGRGMRCCRQEAMRKVGKAWGFVNGTRHDNVWRALLGQLEHTGPTKLYLYSTPEEGFNKFGISFDPEKYRINAPIYNQQLLTPHLHFLCREDAALIEQAYKYGYGCEPPESLEDMEGATELTTETLEEFEETISELMAALNELGRWSFAEEYCDPNQVAIARQKLQEQDAA